MRLIDADALMTWFNDNYDEDEEVPVGFVVGAIREQPTIEPEIIRCKDCKYAHMTYNGECKYCDIWFPDEKTYMNGNHYCGSAERREE